MRKSKLAARTSTALTSPLALIALLTLALLFAAAGASGQQAARNCGPVYDVTVAGLRHYAEAALPQMTPAAITRYVDGDTVHVRMPCPPPGPEADETVRLTGIDTPEVGEPGAAEATGYVRQLTRGETVYLAFDFRRRDRFGRLLAYIYLADGSMLNVRLLECGLAEPFRGERNHFSDHFERAAIAPRPADCPEPRSRERAAATGTAAAASSAPGAVVIETVVNAGRSEHLLLRNASAAAVDVSGWQVSDDDGTRLLIPQTAPLAPGAILALCSGDGCVGDVPSLTLTGDNIWGNGGDAAFLHDGGGRQVSSHCYERGC